MTTVHSGELFPRASSRGRVGGGVGKASWKMPCALFVLCAAIASSAQTFRTVARINDPGFPGGPLVQGIDGNFYGITFDGGGIGRGTVFKVTRGGTLTTVHSFCAQFPACPDGGLLNPLVQAADGNLYGTTEIGGTHNQGTVFKLTPSGTLTTIYSFCSKTNCADGTNPSAFLVQAGDGNLYGTTEAGPPSPCNGPCATIFKITPSGTLTTMVSFDGFPFAELFPGKDGSVYGITLVGGANGRGTVFKLTPSGTLTTLYNFCSQGGFSCTDGETPGGGLVQAADGSLYGITLVGGANGRGTVFRLTPSGTITTIYSFCSQAGCTDGNEPNGLIQATDGNFYGTTIYGGDVTCNPSEFGTSGCGTVFKITPSGTLTTLHSFHEGSNPRTSPLQATDGTFYGVTTSQETREGTVFSLCTGLGWFVETLPNTGTVGSTVRILGTDLTGASDVTFDGLTTPFTVVSATLIQATVPSGATTGSVKVTIPSGTPTSNKRFRVLPQMTSFSPAGGPVGTFVTITGVSLSQTIWSSFGGVGANFTVVDDTTVTATVPTGAKTGRVRITTRGGAATSATDFTVE